MNGDSNYSHLWRKQADMETLLEIAHYFGRQTELVTLSVGISPTRHSAPLKFDLLSKATLRSHFNFIILLVLHFSWKCMLWIYCISAELVSRSDDNTEHQE